jgi:16S rRNA processing protein RimM
MIDKMYIECAKVINTHGCHGGIKLESWCNTADDLAELKRVFFKKNGVYVESKVLKASVFKQFVIFTLDNVQSMDEAMALKNSIAYALRDDFDLSDGEFFISDLIGIDVIDAVSGNVYGQISDIINRGASDIYVIKTADGERMIPAVPEFIKEIDVNKGVLVTPISGMLD